MRSYPSSLLTLALAASALFSITASYAQQTPTPVPATVAPMPVPATVAPVAVEALPTTPDLAIPAPPGAKLRVEMDARSEDLLGMIKAFLTGIGETGTPPAKTPGQPVPPPNPIADALQAGKLAEVLKDVNHVRFVVWELPAPPLPTAPVLPSPLGMPAKPQAKPTKLVPVGLPVVPDAMVHTPETPKFDSNAFYEDAFSREGAHRILFTDADEYKLVMVGFPDKRGFAFAVSGGGYVGVSRTDGYPNLEVLSAFISQMTAAVLHSQTVKKLMDAGINAGIGAVNPGDTHGPSTDDKK
jgi:hypothetical protein